LNVTIEFARTFGNFWYALLLDDLSTFGLNRKKMLI